MNIVKISIIMCALIGLVLPLGMNLLPSVNAVGFSSLILNIALAFLIEIVFTLIGASIGAIIGLVFDGIARALKNNL